MLCAVAGFSVTHDYFARSARSLLLDQIGWLVAGELFDYARLMSQFLMAFHRSRHLSRSHSFLHL